MDLKKNVGSKKIFIIVFENIAMLYRVSLKSIGTVGTVK